MTQAKQDHYETLFAKLQATLATFEQATADKKSERQGRVRAADERATRCAENITVKHEEMQRDDKEMLRLQHKRLKDEHSLRILENENRTAEKEHQTCIGVIDRDLVTTAQCVEEVAKYEDVLIKSRAVVCSVGTAAAQFIDGVKENVADDVREIEEDADAICVDQFEFYCKSKDALMVSFLEAANLHTMARQKIDHIKVERTTAMRFKNIPVVGDLNSQLRRKNEEKAKHQEVFEDIVEKMVVVDENIKPDIARLAARAYGGTPCARAGEYTARIKELVDGPPPQHPGEELERKARARFAISIGRIISDEEAAMLDLARHRRLYAKEIADQALMLGNGPEDLEAESGQGGVMGGVASMMGSFRGSKGGGGGGGAAKPGGGAASGPS